MGFFKRMKGGGQSVPPEDTKLELPNVEETLRRIENQPAAQNIRRQIKRVCKRFRTRNE